MSHTVEHSDLSGDKTKVGKRLRDFLKRLAEAWGSGSPIRSRPQSILSEYLNKIPRFLWISIGFAFVAFAGIMNYPAGADFSHWLFYLIPLFIVTWFTERWPGIMLSTICALTWIIADISSGVTYSNFTIPYWNVAARLGSFLILTFTFSSLIHALMNEKELSRKDSLTGAGNRRYFNELAEMEIRRSLRYKHPFTIIYIDLDDFKGINDHFGHSQGDQLLRSVAQTIQKKVRLTDKVIRLGGDEFAVLLPETGLEAAQVIVSKIQKVPSEIMRKQEWPISFSMGVVTFTSPPSTADEILQISDGLMYAVKNSGKNGIKYEICQITPDHNKKS